MPTRMRLRSPRQPLFLFLGATLVLATGLGWLGWRLLQQDRDLEDQRIREHLESAAQLLAAELRQGLADIDTRLSRLAVLPQKQLVAATSEEASLLGDDTLLAVFVENGIRAFPAHRLAYQPGLRDAPRTGAPELAAGEAYEFRSKEYGKAIEAFRELSRSTDEQVRAGALLGLARNLRKSGRLEEALEVYEELSAIPDAIVGGLPAELAARHARCSVLEELGRSEELAEEAASLHADLCRGRWRLSRGAYLYHLEEARRWLTDAPASPTTGDEAQSADDRDDEDSRPRPSSYLGNQQGQEESLAFSVAVELLWNDWLRDRRNGDEFGGRRNVWHDDRPILLRWRGSGERVVVQALGVRFVEEELLATLQPVLARQRVRLALADLDGRTVLSQYGSEEVGGPVQAANDGRLPWVLSVVSADPTADLGELAARRRLLFASLGLVALVVMVSSYFASRAVGRELEIARMQSDFVAAVSHDFRTPLTSLRQYSELLASGRVADDERRHKYYGFLVQESQRLQRLVEGLLDFGRMEAGAKEFNLEPLPARPWLEEVTAEFQREVEENGYQVDVAWRGPDVTLPADRMAMSQALWNLMDNAVRYSPDSKTVWVEVKREARRLLIHVRDRGLGIEPDERRKIFEKFVRGSAARRRSTQGTGLGLTMVRHTVEAHGGTVRVESEPGEGSTFTISLPVEE